ncbi:hypothetical protein PDJAM_G00170100 [Pangasius djambal]|uniref:Uncharacterized protein n=1 Tax=Pangasius djambal TaxID=1691987 RepID=A0ACC5ZLX9_9TELE|nr:hypothetical protein [Pangasius djambal]
MERPRLMRLRRLQRQCRSQRRRRLKPSSIPPVHPFFFLSFPISPTYSSFPPSPSLPPSLPPSLFLPLSSSFPSFSSRFQALDGPLSPQTITRGIFLSTIL